MACGLHDFQPFLLHNYAQAYQAVQKQNVQAFIVSKPSLNRAALQAEVHKLR